MRKSGERNQKASVYSIVNIYIFNAYVGGYPWLKFFAALFITDFMSIIITLYSVYWNYL